MVKYQYEQSFILKKHRFYIYDPDHLHPCFLICTYEDMGCRIR